jgi:hypothetical protein
MFESDIFDNYPNKQFFNPFKIEASEDRRIIKINWVAFPCHLKSMMCSDQFTYEMGDKNNFQSEYCEWSVERNTNGKIKKVIFTCDFLDLKNNNLNDLIKLASESTRIREMNGKFLIEQQALMRYGKYGDINKISEQLISSKINFLSQNKSMVSLLNPVSVYFDEFRAIGWRAPDKSNVATYFKIKNDGKTAIYEVPESKGFCVSDIKINGRNINYGSQIADFIRMKLYIIAQNIGKTELDIVKVNFS